MKLRPVGVCAGAWLCSAFVAVMPGTVVSQVPASATLVVHVTDTLGAPLESAEAVLRRARRIGTSDPSGRIELSNLSAGTDTLLIRRVGFAPVALRIHLTASDTLVVEAELEPRAVALEEIVVTSHPGLSTFDRRMRSAVWSPPNSFWTPEALDTFPPALKIREILLRSGIIRRPFAGGRYRLACPRDPFGGGPYPLEILLNGVAYPDPDGDFFDFLERIEVKALEIYRWRAEVPLDLPGNPNCVAVVWTR